MNVLPLYLPHHGCPQRCVYCNQHLTVNSPNDYMEWADRLETIDTADPEETWEIAFYGGTFSALSLPRMALYLDQIKPHLERPVVKGFRISTRPDWVDEERLAFLKNNGVTTIELGVESFDDRVLERCQRGHSSAEAKAACMRVRRSGIDLGVHLMCGLPEQTERSWKETVQTAIELRPSFVRIAPTLVLKGTRLESMYRHNVYCPLSLDEAIQQCSYAYKRFHANGIAIARIGLALSDRYGDGSDKVTAGPWHPSLRYEIESRLAAESVLHILEKTSESTIAVNPKDISVAVGSKRKNLRRWRSALNRPVNAVQDKRLPRYWFGIGNNRRYSLFGESEP